MESKYKLGPCLSSREWWKLEGERDVRDIARKQINRDFDKFSSLGHDCVVVEFGGSTEWRGIWILYSLGKTARIDV